MQKKDFFPVLRKNVKEQPFFSNKNK